MLKFGSSGGMILSDLQESKKGDVGGGCSSKGKIQYETFDLDLFIIALEKLEQQLLEFRLNGTKLEMNPLTGF